jgi:hypothetical protein
MTPITDAGLPASSTRRAPGRRREGLAQLAGMPVLYVTRLEQERVTTPSGQVLESLTRAVSPCHEGRAGQKILDQRPPSV